MKRTLLLSLAVVAGSLAGWRALAADTAPAATAAAAPAETAKPAPKATDLFADTVVAKGKGFEIKRGQLDEAMVTFKTGAAAQRRQFTPDQTSALEANMLDFMIRNQLLLAKATPVDKATGKEDANRQFEQFRTQAGSDEAVNRHLKMAGTTKEDLLAKMTDETTARVVLERELKISITDDDVKKFYDENPAKFEQPEMVRASHILLSTREDGKELSAEKKAEKYKLAQDLQARAKKGEDFAKLAEQYSEDPGSKMRGGEYTFPRGQMVPEFETAAFALKTNEVSEIVTTQFGYHIIKLSERIPAKKMELAKMTPMVKDYLKQEQMVKRQQELVDYIKKLKQDAGVEILDESLKVKETPAPAGLPAGHPPVTSGTKAGTK